MCVAYLQVKFWLWIGETFSLYCPRYAAQCNVLLTSDANILGDTWSSSSDARKLIFLFYGVESVNYYINCEVYSFIINTNRFSEAIVWLFKWCIPSLVVSLTICSCKVCVLFVGVFVCVPLSNYHLLYFFTVSHMRMWITMNVNENSPKWPSE